MPDAMLTLDKVDLGHVIGAKRWLGLGRRELIVVGVALCLLLVWLTFVGLYANLGPPKKRQLCVSRDCMYAAAHATELMNKSADPCDDFYQYACGNYKTYNPRTGWQTRSILDDMYEMNTDRVTELISEFGEESHKNDIQGKLTNFLHSCLDVNVREKKAGTPFLNKVIGPLGGWYVLNNWDEDQWDYKQALKKVQADFWVKTLYYHRTKIDSTDHSKRVVHLSFTRLIDYSGYWFYYFYYNFYSYFFYPGDASSLYKSQQEDYKKYTRKIATLLVQDYNQNNVSMSNNETVKRLDQFVTDVINIEVKLGQVRKPSSYVRNTYQKVTLATLNSWSGNKLDWADQLSYLYRPTTFTSASTVIVDNPKEFQNLLNVFKDCSKREWNNYIIWSAAAEYAKDLSQAYARASRQLDKDLGRSSWQRNPTKVCKSKVKEYMGDALGVLYVQEHLAGGSKKQVTNMTASLTKSLLKQLDNATWMDQATRSYAKKKLTKAIFKIGHPDWMGDKDDVDKRYSDFTVKVDDFFGNVLSGDKFLRQREGSLLSSDTISQEWDIEPYDTHIDVSRYWNDIMIPAGILQPPIWNPKAPKYVSFGSLGGLLGRNLISVIDVSGSQRDIQGQYKDWWSKKTRDNYKPMHQCVTDQYKNVTGVKYYRSNDYGLNMALISGIRLALRGYRDWTVAGGSENMLPGLDNLNPQQMVFLSFAQAHCHNMNYWNTKISRHGYGYWAFKNNRADQVADVQVNMALGQLPEFSKAFQCPAKSKMNHKTKCTYY